MSPVVDGKDDRHQGSTPPHGDSPISEQDALLSLKRESLDLLDAARSVEIVGDKLRRLQDSGLAIGTLNMFAADVSVGRDFTTGGAGASRTAPRGGSAPVPVGLAHLADYTAAYVEPPGFADALAVLEKQHLLVLSAAVGTGRDSAALALLTRVVAEHDDANEPALFDLSAESVFTNNSWEVPDKACGYVMTDMEASTGMRVRSARTGTSLERLDDAWLTRVSSLLTEAGSFLVVITGPLRGTLSEATRRNDFVVEHLGTPDPLEIVKARILAAEVDTDPGEVDRRLANAGAAEVLAERPRPRFAVKAALCVVEALKADEDLAVALERLRNPGEQVHEWFGHHEQLDQIAFAVATAVLEDSSFLTVSDAAIELYLQLSPGSAPPLELHFRRTLAADQPWIVLTTPDREAAGASPAAEAVQFRSPQLQPAVLAYAWNQLDGMRPALLAWLRKLVGHPDVEVRARAASAAGLLASGDFQHALHRYLLPWARDKFTLRQSAALALSVVGAVPAHTARVWALLRQWAAEAELGPNRQLPATAALAAGGPLAAEEPHRALRVLRTLLVDGGWDLLQPAALSILHLVENGRSAEVLRTLMAWTEPDEASSALIVKGLVAYVFAARQTSTDSSPDYWADAEAGDVRGPSWPVLLTVAHHFPDELPELWGRALDSPTVRPLALEALREWLRVVDGDWAAFPIVLDVLAGVVDRGDRDLERLEYHLDRWARDEDDPSAAAGRIFDALADAG